MVRPPRSSSRTAVLAVGAERLVVEDRLEDEVAEERRPWSPGSRSARPAWAGSGQRGGLRPRRRRPVGISPTWAIRASTVLRRVRARVRVAGRVERRRAAGRCRRASRPAAGSGRGLGVEVTLGGRLDAVRAGAEVRDVEVALEDLAPWCTSPPARPRSAARAACGCRTARSRPSAPPRAASGPGCLAAVSSSTCLTYCWVRVEPPWTSVAGLVVDAARGRCRAGRCRRARRSASPRSRRRPCA